MHLQHHHLRYRFHQLSKQQLRAQKKRKAVMNRWVFQRTMFLHNSKYVEIPVIRTKKQTHHCFRNGNKRKNRQRKHQVITISAVSCSNHANYCLIYKCLFFSHSNERWWICQPFVVEIKVSVFLKIAEASKIQSTSVAYVSWHNNTVESMRSVPQR